MSLLRKLWFVIATIIVKIIISIMTAAIIIYPSVFIIYIVIIISICAV